MSEPGLRLDFRCSLGSGVSSPKGVLRQVSAGPFQETAVGDRAYKSPTKESDSIGMGVMHGYCMTQSAVPVNLSTTELE